MERVRNFNDWLVAFCNYMTIFLAKHPSKGPQMAQYITIIREQDRLHPWHRVYNYDIAFQEEIQANFNQDWGNLDNVLFAAHVISPACAQFNATNTQASPSTITKTKESCKKYNGGRCNFRSKCKYQHKCTICRKFYHPTLK